MIEVLYFVELTTLELSFLFFYMRIFPEAQVKKLGHIPLPANVPLLHVLGRFGLGLKVPQHKRPRIGDRGDQHRIGPLDAWHPPVSSRKTQHGMEKEDCGVLNGHDWYIVSTTLLVS